MCLEIDQVCAPAESRSPMFCTDVSSETTTFVYDIPVCYWPESGGPWSFLSVPARSASRKG